MIRMMPLFALLSVSIVSIAQTAISINGQPDWKKGVDISGYTLSYEETGNKPLSVQQVKDMPFKAFKEDEDRYAQRPQIISWLKFVIRNTSPHDTLRLYLNVNAHRYIRLYEGDSLRVERGTHIRGGHLDRFGIPLLVLPLQEPTYWLKVEERVRYITPFYAHLETPYTYFKWLALQYHQERWLRFLLPLMSGFLLLISIFGLYQYYLLRDTTFLYYFLYAFFAFLLSFFCMEERFDLMALSNKMRTILDAILWNAIPAGYILFMSKILNMPEHFPRAWIACKIILVILLVQSTITYVEYFTAEFLFESSLYYSYLAGLPGLFANVILLIVCIRSTSPVKYFLIFGLTGLLALFFIPVCIGFARFSETLDYELASILDYGPFFFVLGICVEASSFAFALAYRSKLVVDERNELQSNYAHALQFELNKRTEELQIQNKLLEEQKIKQLETEFAHKIAETEMSALRAQMNPHFIFNCLNSIKLYTLENDSATASEYLTKFSQLIRIVLENSRSEKVTLEKELATLCLYIDLEAMRFKNKVQYQINCASGIEQEYIEIPPLILQPYVENAIWHGLMHKEDGGLITIDITQPAERILLIEITDNGIGRDLAQEFKSKSATRRKSFGHKMTSERIQTINQVYQTNTAIEIIDLKDGNNNASGTKVIIQIPI